MSHLTEQHPPFPTDVPTAQVTRVSLSKLLSNDKAETDALFEACKTSGLFMVALDDGAQGEELIGDASNVFRAGEKIFDLDYDEKMKYAMSWKTSNGYKSYGMTKVDNQGTPDRCEFFTLSRDAILGVSEPSPAPEVIIKNKDSFKSFMLHAHALVSLLFSHLDSHLHFTPGTISSRHRPIYPSGCQTRILKFVPQSETDRRTSFLPHTDYATMTVLFNAIGGLQILPQGKDDLEENWIFVKPEKGCAIINLGDAMAKWTNGLLKSPLHRVTYAPGAQSKEVRYSVAYFARPERDAPMKRIEGSQIIPQLADGVVEEEITASEWQAKMTGQAKSSLTLKA